MHKTSLFPFPFCFKSLLHHDRFTHGRTPTRSRDRMALGFVCWIHGEGQPALPAEKSSWMPAGRSRPQWGAGGLRRRKERVAKSPVPLCCQVPDTWQHLPAACLQHCPLSTGPLGLLCGHLPECLSLLGDTSWHEGVRLQEGTCRDSVLPFCDALGFTKNPSLFRWKRVSPLVSKGGKTSLGRKNARGDLW